MIYICLALLHQQLNMTRAAARVKSLVIIENMYQGIAFVIQIYVQIRTFEKWES
jgi:hypothetical protein